MALKLTTLNIFSMKIKGSGTKSVTNISRHDYSWEFNYCIKSEETCI